MVAVLALAVVAVLGGSYQLRAQSQKVMNAQPVMLAQAYMAPQAAVDTVKDENISPKAKQRAQDRRDNYLRMTRQRFTSKQLKAAGKRLAAAKAAVAAKQKNNLLFKIAALAPPGPGGLPDYFGTTPNWAYTPALTKFIDPLPGLYVSGVSPAPAPGTQYIPVAVPDTSTYPGSDYYEIELGQYTEKMHSDLPPTTLRGYRQTNAPDPVVNVFHYLGPMIIAQKDKPVRIKFTNNLPTGTGGNLFIPVDTTIMGSGPFDINFNPATKESISPNLTGMFAQNRANIHLHGGRTPWISDGTPHQWITPAGESTSYPKGVSVAYVPDMWFDASGNAITSCAGSTTCGTPGATNNPGPGAQTYYYTNQQSARLMFYHDHAWGITRLNVYAGGAAGYLLRDATENNLISTGVIPSDEIPLIIQDKTFVDAATIGTTDPTWNWGTTAPAAHSGDLWWPHVYMPAQNPYNPDFSGINPMGRWAYGPWFWPPTNNIPYGPVDNEYYDPINAPWEPPKRPGTPNVSWGAEAFLDTPVVNGTAYPTLTVDPKPYRLRILNAAHDRFFNLQMYQASSIVSSINLAYAPTGTVWWLPTVAPAWQIQGTADFDGDSNPDLLWRDPGSGLNLIWQMNGSTPTGTVWWLPTVAPAWQIQGTADFDGDSNPDLLWRDPGSGLNLIWQMNHSGGSGYTSDPAVTITNALGDTTGKGATAIATADVNPASPTYGQITSINILTTGSGYTAAPTITISGGGGTGAVATANVYTATTEVGMLPAIQTPAFPASWPADGRAGGVPDPVTSGPSFIQIGTEGGFLPTPVVLPNQPVAWNLDPTTFTAGLVLQQNEGGGTLMLGPAERADVIVDFSQFAGKTLILYNDAPAPWPALDPHYDYYTCAPDNRDMGGAAPTLAGKGPNTRTIMQIKVNAGTGTPFNLANLQTAFTSIAGSPGVFQQGQNPIIVGQTAYNSAYNTTFPATWPNWGVARISDNAISFQTPDGTIVSDFPLNPKAIQDEMGEVFDDYGRMSAKLGLELPFTTAQNQTFVLQNYVDPPTEIVQNNQIQIWKITHNGVDTHPIHFHLFEVQVLNRVGWDGFIYLPDPNELGWKDTVRVSPLEDTIVALRAVVPTVPFAVPDSVRPLNPAYPLGSTTGFTNIDPLTGQPLATPTTNILYNFGNEYVWHCHILSHEENDMMRSIVAMP
jgi:FtsP/CotA-like multicopper oxidase with cupredoxin domain